MPVEFALYTPTMIAALMAGAFLAAAVVGAAGFGDGLVLGAVWFHVFEPTVIVPLIVVQGFCIYTGTLVPIRKQLDFRHLPALAVGGIIGTPVGIWLLGVADPDVLKTILGVILLSIAAFRLIAPNTGTIARGGRPADGAIGAVAGLLGGFAGLAGVLPTIWAELRGWGQAAARGAYQPFVVVAQIAAVIGFAASGQIDWGVAIAGAIVAPAVVLGALFGILVFRRLPPAAFRRMVLALVGMSGLGLVL